MRILTDTGKFAGNYDSIDRLFTKKVHGSRHMLHEPPAWAMDASVHTTLDMMDCDYIQVEDIETGKAYVVDFQTFSEKSIEIDRGCGRQLALPLSYWHIRQPDEYF